MSWASSSPEGRGENAVGKKKPGVETPGFFEPIVAALHRFTVLPYRAALGCAQPQLSSRT
jgi:hypothetical protein